MPSDLALRLGATHVAGPAAAGRVVAEVTEELTIFSPRAARPRGCDLAISLCAGRRLDLAPLVTARFPLARADDAPRRP